MCVQNVKNRLHGAKNYAQCAWIAKKSKLPHLFGLRKDYAAQNRAGSMGNGMCELTQGQRMILFLADKMGEAPIGAQAICPGFHFCPDLDFLPICADSPEWEICTCPREARDD